jgi:hypothetical protein
MVVTWFGMLFGEANDIAVLMYNRVDIKMITIGTNFIQWYAFWVKVIFWVIVDHHAITIVSDMAICNWPKGLCFISCFSNSYGPVVGCLQSYHDWNPVMTRLTLTYHWSSTNWNAWYNEVEKVCWTSIKTVLATYCDLDLWPKRQIKLVINEIETIEARVIWYFYNCSGCYNNVDKVLSFGQFHIAISLFMTHRAIVLFCTTLLVQRLHRVQSLASWSCILLIAAQAVSTWFRWSASIVVNATRKANARLWASK